MSAPQPNKGHDKQPHLAMQAVVKPTSGKGAARAMRRAGYTPAVVYGSGQEPQHLGISTKDLQRALRLGHFYTQTHELSLDGKTSKVLAKSIQRDPVTDEPLHLDFLRYNASSQVSISVSVRLEGEADSPGLKEGGVLQLIETNIEVICRADSIPEEIVIDVSKLDVGESIHLSDITLPQGARAAVTDRDLTIASIISTRTSTMAELDAEADAVAAGAVAASAEVPAIAQKDDGKAAPADDKDDKKSDKK